MRARCRTTPWRLSFFLAVCFDAVVFFAGAALLSVSSVRGCGTAGLVPLLGGL